MSDKGNLLQTKTVLSNELRLHDNNLSKMAMTFGNADQDGEQAYLNIKFKATDNILNYHIDRKKYNIVGPTEITVNDYKIWNETNDGPNSGLNADLLDGRHATEFKDRYGYHHFLHQVKPSTNAKKHWVKIATFTTRKIGNNKNLDFNAKGEPAFGGVFQYSGNGVNGVSSNDVVIPGGNLQAVQTAMTVQNIREQFKINTPEFLEEYDPDVFHSTSLLTEGVYNGALRGHVTVLKNNNPTTFDFHVGLFEDPLCEDEDGWSALHKYFYVSLHDSTLPFLDEDAINDPIDLNNLNKGYVDGVNVNEDTDDKNNETKLNGIVQNGYNVGSNTNFPNFPYYSWDYNYEGGVLTYNNKDMIDNNISSGASVPNAMANISYVPVDKTKSKALRELKLQYGNDTTQALNDTIQRLQDVGLAMANEDGENTDEDDNKIKESFDEFLDRKEEAEDNLDDLKDTDSPKEEDIVEHHNGPISRIHLNDYNKTNTGGKPYVTGNYAEPPMTEQDAEPYARTRRRKPFPPRNKAGEGEGYQTYIDIMRLYHVSSRADIVDGLQVVTHTFELYMAIDEKSEIRIQPYLSSACLLENFQPCLQEADLPQKKFIRPKSIYDSRYASVRHRHYDYERRVWELTLETDQIWKNFKRYITIDQGMDNKNKVMCTDSQGKIYAAVDNMVRHCEPTETNPDTGELKRREGGRVLITSKPSSQTIENCSSPIQASCVGESSITIDELAALEGIKGNIQDQIDNLWDGIDDIWYTLDALEDVIDSISDEMGAMKEEFVKIPGDTMTGGLWMEGQQSTYEEDANRSGGIPVFGFYNGGRVGYTYGGTPDCDIGWANGPGLGDWCAKWNNGFAINGTRICFGDVDPTTGKYENDGGLGFSIDLKEVLNFIENHDDNN